MLLNRLLLCGHCCSYLVHLIDGYELLSEQWLNAMKVIRLVSQLRIRAVESRLGIRDIGLGLIHSRGGTIYVCCRAVCIRTGRAHGAHLRGDRSALVADLTFQRVQV